jgi:uncharacterized protein
MAVAAGLVRPLHAGKTMAIIDDDQEIARVLRDTRRVAVLGIKPETHRSAAAHYVAAYLQQVGYEIVPVPVYYPEVTVILGEPVYRSLAAVPGPVDLVLVFRRPRDIPPHVDDILAKAPSAVWFQLGIYHAGAAERLAAAGMDVVQNRCAMIDHRLI